MAEEQVEAKEEEGSRMGKENQAADKQMVEKTMVDKTMVGKQAEGNKVEGKRTVGRQTATQASEASSTALSAMEPLLQRKVAAMEVETQAATPSQPLRLSPLTLSQYWVNHYPS